MLYNFQWFTTQAVPLPRHWIETDDTVFSLASSIYDREKVRDARGALPCVILPYLLAQLWLMLLGQQKSNMILR